MNPVVSVLMPVAAPAPFLGAALDSIVQQEFDGWELVLVVDGPSKDVEDVARATVPIDRLHIIVNETRQGVAASLNSGLQAARGTLIARLDADDLCAPERLRVQADFMNQNPSVALVGAGATIISANGDVLGVRKPRRQDPRAQLPRRNQFIHSSVMFRKSVVLGLGGYRVAAELREDYDLWLRVAMSNSIANLDRPLVKYRISHGQHSRRRPTPQCLALIRSQQRALSARLGRNSGSALLLRSAWRLGQLGIHREAARLLLPRPGGAMRRNGQGKLSTAKEPAGAANDEVQGSLAEVQRELRNALSVVERVASDLGVTYFLDAGSALGAARYGGFIPWDDDIDLAMPARDFRTFVSRAGSMMPDSLAIHTRHDDPVLGAPAKIYVNGSRANSSFGTDHRLRPPLHPGIFIDLFPIYPLSRWQVVRRIERIAGWLTYVRPWAYRMGISRRPIGARSRARFLIAWLIPLPLVRMIETLLWQVALHRRSTQAGIGLGGINGRKFDISTLLPPQVTSFDGVSTRVPRDLTGFLLECYGENYLEEPPIEQRRRHSQVVFFRR